MLQFIKGILVLPHFENMEMICANDNLGRQGGLQEGEEGVKCGQPFGYGCCGSEEQQDQEL